MQQYAWVKQLSASLFSPKSDKQADKSLGRATEPAGEISFPRNQKESFKQQNMLHCRPGRQGRLATRGLNNLAYIKKRVGQQQDRNYGGGQVKIEKLQKGQESSLIVCP